MKMSVLVKRSQTLDYKSTALPAELQGHILPRAIYDLKDQLNQSKKD